MSLAHEEHEHDELVLKETTARSPQMERLSSAQTFEIVVIEGPQAGTRVLVEPHGSCQLVGQSPTCAVRIDDPTVASRQCSFENVGSRLKLVDLSPAGTTRVNGVAAREALLSGGEIIRIGDSVLSINRLARNGARQVARSAFGRVRGESGVMRSLYPVLEEVARTGGHLALEGERGTGKRLIAEEVHRAGRASGPFVVLDSRGLAPAEIAFRLLSPGGLFERARGGTLFIDELTALDEACQGKLATALLRMANASVGVRLVCASRRPLRGSLVDALARCFGGHLGVRVVVPALRERLGDVTLLARSFWTELGGVGSLPDDFAARFHRHHWPGNVRELRIAVQDRIVHGSGPDVEAAISLPPSNDHLERVIASDLPFVRARHEIIAEFEKRYVTRALARSGRNVARAAAQSGVAHRYFQVIKARREVT